MKGKNIINGKVKLTPTLVTLVTGSSTLTDVVQTNERYETKKYAGFSISDRLPVNYFYTQTISFVNTEVSGRNKIRRDISVGI